MRIRVIAPEGRYVTGYGSREQGGEFELPDELAERLLREQPGKFERVEEEPTEEKVEV